MYARIGHILLEISTDGPGFMGDEPYETLGEKLSLPPFLEEQREAIEAQVRLFDTTGKVINREVLNLWNQLHTFIIFDDCRRCSRNV